MKPGTSHKIAFTIALLLMFGAAAGFRIAAASLKLYLIKLPIEVELKLPSVPTETASWKQVGVDEAMSDEMVQELGTTNYVSRTYLEKHPPAEGDPVAIELHMAYYTGMVDTVPHIPDRCLVGGGWSIAGSTSVMPLSLDQDVSVWRLEDVPGETGRVFSARLGPTSRAPGVRVRLPRDADKIEFRVNPYNHPGQNRRLYAGYFFIANGGHCQRAEDVRLLAFRLTDSYAYYLKVQFSSASVKDEQEFARACASLLGELLPDIMLCVPDWVDVLRGDYPPDNPRKGAASTPNPPTSPGTPRR
jgi:hypothetical protein